MEKSTEHTRDGGSVKKESSQVFSRPLLQDSSLIHWTTGLAALFFGMWLSEVIDPGWLSRSFGFNGVGAVCIFIVFPATWILVELLWALLFWPREIPRQATLLAHGDDQPWRQPTDFLYIERLKAELLSKESYLTEAAFYAACFATKLQELEENIGGGSRLFFWMFRLFYSRRLAM